MYSVLTARTKTPFNLLVIEDRGPDDDLRVKLNEFSQDFQFEYHQHEENKGFVLTCNYGFSLHPERDVVLLNSDTQVYDDWLDNLLACAEKYPTAGTITAMSNSATICSYPCFVEDYPYQYEISDAELSVFFAEANRLETVDTPTGVGFCMYVRRKCLENIGYFDYESFGKGYGEENDLCVRVEKAGWRNLIAGGVFVRHHGSSSFSSEVREERVKHALKIIKKLHPGHLPSVSKFIEADTVAIFRQRVDMKRLKHFIQNKPVMLFVSHNLGGGTEKHHLEMVEKLAAEGYAVISLKPNKKQQPVLHLEGIHPLPNIPIPRNTDGLIRFLKEEIKATAVHFHHLKGFTTLFIDNLTNALRVSSIPYYFTVHDYLPICPQITLMKAGHSIFCGEPDKEECNHCIQGNPEAQPHQYDIQKYRHWYGNILHGAEKVFVPDEDVKWRLQRYFNGLPIHVRPHFDIWPEYHDALRPFDINSNRRIGIIGAIGLHKGFNMVCELAEKCRRLGLDITFVIIGYTMDDNRLRSLDNVEILGAYQDKELQETIHKADLDAIWFPAVCPETYSYTLSAALSVKGMPIIAFDFGAIARRLRNCNGILIPIEKMLKPAQVLPYLLLDFRHHQIQNVSTRSEYSSMIRDYYQMTE
ncbi:glycosyltransferase [Neisseria animalis]|uniref:glycosyltransferase n=1 Tax=Neisseria animalis TaxID=492 RepID=UPI001E28FBFE|nr:glycosyltransferase [Neisseria animalis]